MIGFRKIGLSLTVTVVAFFLATTFLSINPALADHEPGHNKLKLLGQEINCYPELAPSHPDGCGIANFIDLIKKIIKFLMTYVAIPIAILMMIWAGYVIITAGGSQEKYRHGKEIITTAIIGLAIALTAIAVIDIIEKLFNRT